VPAPLLTIDPTGDAIISAQAPDAFTGKYVVGLYYPTGPKPAKFDIVVMKNGNPANVKVLATNVTVFPTTLTVTGVQLRTLFGTAVALGDTYDLGANITTTDGGVYPAFPTNGAAAFSTGILSQPGFSPTVRFAAVCKFTATDYGAYGVPTPYVVQRDDWADYQPGDVINVTVIDATHMSFKYAANNAQPIVIIVNPANNATSVASQVIGNYGPPFGDFSVVSVPDNGDVVAPCALTVGVKLHFTESKGGDFGNGVIMLKKQ